MKKILAISLVLSLVLALCPLGAFSETASGTCGEKVTWSFDSETGTLTISGEGDMEDYAYISDPTEGYYLTVPWYKYQNMIRYAVIQSNVTSVGNNAFNFCRSLRGITIPESVSSIGKSAFNNCYSLESITVDENNKVYLGAGNCLIEKESGTLVLGCKNSVIPDDISITLIGNYAFHCSEGLKSITIPEGVTSIGYCAFFSCGSLTHITIPDSVTKIGGAAFDWCDSLTSVTIGNSVAWIDECAFHYCPNLTTVIYNGTKKEWNAITIGSDNEPLLNAEIIFKPCEHEKGTWNIKEDNTKENVCKECGAVVETLGADEFIPNDVNGDNKINVFDYYVVKNVYFRGSTDGAMLKRADVNGDGKINVFDYYKVKTAYFQQ